MASTLDMLDSVHGGGRDFLAEQIVAGASNAQMADALAAKFGIDPPTIRSVGSLRVRLRKVEGATVKNQRVWRIDPNTPIESSNG